jgi:hypothetical protein
VTTSVALSPVARLKSSLRTRNSQCSALCCRCRDATGDPQSYPASRCTVQEQTILSDPVLAVCLESAGGLHRLAELGTESIAQDGNTLFRFLFNHQPEDDGFHTFHIYGPS